MKDSILLCLQLEVVLRLQPTAGFVQANKRTEEPCMLVSAPSNVAVDQMADKISQTGLKVWSDPKG